MIIHMVGFLGTVGPSIFDKILNVYILLYKNTVYYILWICMLMYVCMYVYVNIYPQKTILSHHWVLSNDR